MPKEIVLDIETQNSFADTGPKRDIRLLKVSLVGIYDFAKEEYHVFMENELPDFRQPLLILRKVVQKRGKVR